MAAYVALLWRILYVPAMKINENAPELRRASVSGRPPWRGRDAAASESKGEGRREKGKYARSAVRKRSFARGSLETQGRGEA